MNDLKENIKSKAERYTGDPYTYTEYVAMQYGVAVTDAFTRTESVQITNE